MKQRGYPLSDGIFMLLGLVAVGCCMQPLLADMGGVLYVPNMDAVRAYFEAAHLAQWGAKVKPILLPTEEPFLSPVYTVLGWGIWRNGVAGVHGLWLLGLLGAVWGIYGVLKTLKVSWWFAGLVSVWSLFLLPDVQELPTEGIQSVSFAAFFPILWYLLLRQQRRKHLVLYTHLLIGWIIISGFISPVYWATGSVFVLGNAFINTLRRLRSLSHFLIPLLYQYYAAITPLVVVYLFLKYQQLTLPPYVSHTIYHITLADWLVPAVGTLRSNIGAYIALPSHSSIGLYIGVPTASILLVAVLRWLNGIRHKKYWQLLSNIRLSTALWAVLLGYLLVYATLPTNAPLYLQRLHSWIRIDIVWHNLHTVLLLTTYYYLYLLYRYAGRWNKVAAYSWLGFVVLWAGTDAYTQYQYLQKAFAEHLQPATLLCQTNDDLLLSGYTADDFQAVLPMPISDSTLLQAYRVALSSGLPIIDNTSPALSYTEQSLIQQLYSHPLIEKQWLRSLTHQPLLGVISAPTPPFTEGIQSVGKNLYRISQTAFDPRGTIEQILAPFEQTPNKLHKYTHYWTTRPTDLVHLEQYNNLPEGLLNSYGLTHLHLFNQYYPQLTDSVSLSITVWVEPSPNCPLPQLEINTTQLGTQYINPSQHIFRQQTAYMATTTLYPHDTLTLRMVQTAPYCPYQADNLLIHPIHTDVYHLDAEVPNKTFWNTLPLYFPQ